ncbi:ferredoxin reductase family protein [Actinacidiphila oryziradicis]|jgi:predicted ferric reductase|uniref:ferredoxin reductase family protein n=1 Tax=Actinacidiphila oryziradicis TaxID=2571141 RepID=UPI0023F115F2|nr:ferredoxin reductase family protein [Actinacidiphila oryziradicis]MCW2870956.1 ferric reductase [Actinacidiphila oryziradicis]
MMQNTRAGRRATMRAIRPRRSPAVPLLALTWAGAVAVLWMWWNNTPRVALGTNDWLLGAGRLTGLLGGYTIALVIAQMARIPALERRVGSDRVARWHAMSGRYAICLIVAHVVLTIWAYSLQANTAIIGETVTVVTTFPDMIKATIGTVLLIIIGLVSAGAVRRRMKYETWYYLHLLTYLAVFLTFWHQLATGAEFIGNQTARTVWYVMYGTVTVLLVWYRLLVPVRLNLKHQMRVEATVEEAPGIVSVLITGRKLHRLGAQAGQFFRWRFLAPGMRFSSNPYSLSAAPRPGLLRITVKAVGGHSSALASLKPGTRVWAEGPYGAMTAARRRGGKVLLLAGGAGITPLRALFETMPADRGDLTLLYRAKKTEDLALWDELRAIADERGARLMYAVNGPDGSRPEITPDGLKKRVPDLNQHDVYLCGPPGMAEEMYSVLREAGVPSSRIHHESFEM